MSGEPTRYVQCEVFNHRLRRSLPTSSWKAAPSIANLLHPCPDLEILAQRRQNTKKQASLLCPPLCCQVIRANPRSIRQVSTTLHGVRAFTRLSQLHGPRYLTLHL